MFVVVNFKNKFDLVMIKPLHRLLLLISEYLFRLILITVITSVVWLRPRTQEQWCLHQTDMIVNDVRGRLYPRSREKLTLVC